MPEVLKSPDQNEFLRLLSKSLQGGTQMLNNLPSSYFAPPAIRPFVSNESNNWLGNTFVKPTQTLAEDASYGMPLYSGKGMTFRPDPRFLDAAGIIPSLKPIGSIANIAGKTVAKELARQVETNTGLLGKYTIDPRAYIHLPNTPLNPNELVGTRFDRESIGGLANKKKINLEDYRGASIVPMPYDLSSRNYKITNVSDVQLPNEIITHGGQDYARDIKHINEGVIGASNAGIADRIKTRADIAKQENLAKGGTGQVLLMPTTMGAGSENFSVQPTQVFLGLLDVSKPSKAAIKELDNSIRTFKEATGVGEQRRIIQPYKNFSGVMTEEGRNQLLTGQNIEGTAGNLRKAFADRMAMKQNQEKFKYNIEDVIASIQDPSLRGVPKGYAGNTVLSVNPEGMKLIPTNKPTYNTDFTGKFEGSLGYNAPLEILMMDRYNDIAKTFHGKKSDLRNMTIGALEKRKSGISSMVDDAMLERMYQYQLDQKKKGLL